MDRKTLVVYYATVKRGDIRGNVHLSRLRREREEGHCDANVTGQCAVCGRKFN